MSTFRYERNGTRLTASKYELHGNVGVFITLSKKEDHHNILLTPMFARCLIESMGEILDEIDDSLSVDHG